MYHIITGIVSGGGLVTKSCPTLVTPWTVALQAPLSMRFSRQEYWTGFPFPTPEDLPDSGTETASLESPAFFYHCASWEAHSRLTDTSQSPGSEPLNAIAIPALWIRKLRHREVM